MDLINLYKFKYLKYKSKLNGGSVKTAKQFF